ncbi:hypothetical protein MMC32_008165 [Xylographa parallela]|nr:hypothetical protein [Xylographa parallela]
MAKPVKSKIDSLRDPRRQPVPKESIHPIPNPASKGSATTTTAVPSSRGPSKKEKKLEVSSETAHPSTLGRSKSRSQSMISPNLGKDHILATTISPSVAQTNASHHNDSERGHIQPADRTSAKSTTPSPFPIGLVKQPNPLYTDTSVLNVGSLPLRSTARPDDVNLTLSDGLEEGVIEELKALQDNATICQKATLFPEKLPQIMETNLTDSIRVEALSKNKPQVSQDTDYDHEEGQVTLPESEAQQPIPNHSMRHKRKPAQPAVSGVTPSEGNSRQWLNMIVIDRSEDSNLERGGQLRTQRTSEALAHKVPLTSSSLPSQTPEADPSQTLLYNSKDRVRKNDLVIRIRDPEPMKSGSNKHDRLDVYDGPFRISRLPKSSGLWDSRKNMEKDSISTQTLAGPLGATDTERMKAALVKLHFPNNSKGKALTKLGRLRPVFEIPHGVPADGDARSCYNSAEIEGRGRSVLNTLVLDKESDNDKAQADVQGVCRIQKGAYVKVDFVAHEGPGGESLFEVEKLRGKRVDRHPRNEFPDEKMDDPMILQYLDGGGVLDKSQVLVVKYLVHWAGWPSEDDTWERAQGNIPQEFVDQYRARMPDLDVVIPDPPNKRRKSESLGAKQVVKGS